MPGRYGIDDTITLGALAMIRASLIREDAGVAIAVVNRYGGDRAGNEDLCRLTFDLVAFSERVLLESCGYDVAAAIRRVDELLSQTSARITGPPGPPSS